MTRYRYYSVAECVLGVLRKSAYELPPDAMPQPIWRQKISEGEINEFLNRIKFQEDTDREIRSLLRDG